MRCPEVELVPDAPPPEALFGDVSNHPYTLWLDSADRGPGTGRYSFLAVDPFLTLRTRGGRVTMGDREGRTELDGPSFEALGRLLAEYQLDSVPDLPPFQGGAAGYLGYELARELERVPAASERGPHVPDLDLGFYDLVVAWDHAAGACWVMSCGWPELGAAGERRARERLEAGRRWVTGEAPPPGPAPSEEAERPEEGKLADTRETGLLSSFSPGAYRAAVAEAIEYILAGDVFQVNLSQRFELPLRESAPLTYARLRARNPAPFGAFFGGSGATILSSSPERFLRCDASGAVETRPIKGTRPRSGDPGDDRRLADSLRGSRKDLAENLMIVDLLRNDLSRVCRPGSIAVPALFELESYATVHHLVSVVTGELEEGLGAVDLLTAAFPGGSVTGAPKIRAMEIIAELEPVPRGPYCGAIGYVGFDGHMDTNIAIRTIVQADDRSYFHAGGAVVADSDPDDEYEETLDKAAGLVAAFDLDPGVLRTVD